MGEFGDKIREGYSDVRREFDDLIFRSRDLIPKVLSTRITEENDKYIVISEVPGLAKESVEIEFEKNTLSITANYKDHPFRDGKWSWGSAFNEVDADKIEASVEKGILSVTLFKKEKAIPKKIKIN